MMNELDQKASKKLQVALKKLQRMWGTKVCDAKKLDQELFELRVPYKGIKYRFLFRTYGNALVILHLLAKKSWKIAQKDKKTALERFRRYLQLNG